MEINVTVIRKKGKRKRKIGERFGYGEDHRFIGLDAWHVYKADALFWLRASGWEVHDVHSELQFDFCIHFLVGEAHMPRRRVMNFYYDCCFFFEKNLLWLL